MSTRTVASEAEGVTVALGFVPSAGSTALGGGDAVLLLCLAACGAAGRRWPRWGESAPQTPELQRDEIDGLDAPATVAAESDMEYADVTDDQIDVNGRLVEAGLKSSLDDTSILFDCDSFYLNGAG